MKIKLRHVASLLLSSFIGVFLLSGIFIFSETGMGWWSIELSTTYPLLIVFLMFLIGLLCGALVVHLSKVTKRYYIFGASGFTGVVTMIFYAIITIFVNWNDLVGTRSEHYAWSGTMGYIGDVMFLALIVLLAYGMFILPGFVVGGFIPYFLRKNKSPELKSKPHSDRYCPSCGRNIPMDAGICPYCSKKFW